MRGGTLAAVVRRSTFVTDTQLRFVAMVVEKNRVDESKFNGQATLPFELRLVDFRLAMQDVYNFFFDANSNLAAKGLQRLEDTLRPAIMSGVLTEILTASLAKHSRALTANRYVKGHPDLVVKGAYPGNSVKAGEHGVEIKAARKFGGAVDSHGARFQWMCLFVYDVDDKSEPESRRRPLSFQEVYLGKVTTNGFHTNPQGKLGSRTATRYAQRIAKLRRNWLYRVRFQFACRSVRVAPVAA